MRKIERIIWHCSATLEGRDYTVEDIRRWHLARGKKDIGYHFVIYRDGTVAKGRPVEQAGAHVHGLNATSIGICYIGGLIQGSRRTLARDTRTSRQKASLWRLTAELLAQYPGATVHGHNEFSAKDCPCFCVATEWAKVAPTVVLGPGWSA